MDDVRPDPDQLLTLVQRDESRRTLGKLTIFFGFAPGVGKTYSMLTAAQRLRAEGKQVCIGVVETHGRPKTQALVAGLEVVPMRTVSHRGHELRELDVDALIHRKPALALVDELAHHNAPNSRHSKRHQDVAELLSAGIDVFTTVNVQHIESLNDVVERITGVRVRETVPDLVFDQADEVVLVDLAPNELKRRLEAGDVYGIEQSAQARSGFFRDGNLLALRELALRRAAERADSMVRAFRVEHAIDKVWPAADRVLVCVGPAPQSANVIRGARRMASRLHAPWTALWVEELTGQPLSTQDRQRVDQHLRLAESLGAQIATMTGTRAPAIVAHARRINANRIVLGKPTHPRWRDLFFGDFTNEVIRLSEDIEVHVIAGDPGEGQTDARLPRGTARWTSDGMGFAGLTVAATTALAFGLEQLLGLPDIVMLYLFCMLLIGARTGPGAATFGSLLCVAAYDFFFIPPKFRFDIADSKHALTFTMLFVVGLGMSTLTRRQKRQETAAQQRELRTLSLYEFNRALTLSTNEAEANHKAVTQLSTLLQTGLALLLKPSATQPLQLSAQFGAVWLDAQALSVAAWCLEHRRPAGFGTDSLPGAPFWCLPLIGSNNTSPWGVLCLAPREDGTLLDQSQRALLDTCVNQWVLVIERMRLEQAATAATLQREEATLRHTLLSSVSHDLRTPLAVITGAATALQPRLADSLVDAELANTIAEESGRLERMVGNILDMVKLDAFNPNGTPRVVLRETWLPLEELTSAVFTRLQPLLDGRELVFEAHQEELLLFVDPSLFEQLLMNLVDNAIKHTERGTRIVISAKQGAGAATLVVSDNGKGFTAEQATRLFDDFFRLPTPTNPHSKGSGLGLAICRAIVRAHKGTLVARPRTGGGAQFEITLPQPGLPELSAAFPTGAE